MARTGLVGWLRLSAALLLGLALASGAGPRRADDKVDYRADIDSALEQMQAKCGHFFKVKGIDWGKVEKQFKKEAKGIESPEDELVVLTRLVARLRDGHSYVISTSEDHKVEWPDERWKDLTGPGLFLCKIGKKLYVKNAFAGAASIDPGSEVIKVNGKKAAKWLEAQVERVSEFSSFSTDQQAFFYTCHWGLADKVGTKLTLDVKQPSGQKRTYKLTYREASTVPQGPAYFPLDRIEGGKLSGGSNVHWGLLDSGLGYVHVRRCKGELPEELQDALDDLSGATGLILDFRGNSGGGFDHEDFFGRLLPKGTSFGVGKTYVSTGPAPYGGPLVVIVDGTVRSAGETAAGILKEDGRAYMIGESATAGMSSSKEMLELPSGLFSIRVSVSSNKLRFNGGRGIEGIGVIPHELVEFDPKDLAAERDTLILRAEELLLDYPKRGFPQSVPFEAR